MEDVELRGAQFKKKEWKDIEAGPPPFSALEIAILEARRLFRWRVVGIASNGDLQFEVHNRSNLILPYLSIGIRESCGRRGTAH